MKGVIILMIVIIVMTLFMGLFIYSLCLVASNCENYDLILEEESKIKSK